MGEFTTNERGETDSMDTGLESRTRSSVESLWMRELGTGNTLSTSMVCVNAGTLDKHTATLTQITVTALFD
jgi:hypothetical protein